MNRSIIDSHHHFWTYGPAEYGWIGDGMDVLKHDFLPLDLKTELMENGVAGAISVQARQTVEETEWLLKLANENDGVLGVVGWVPLASPDLESTLETFDDAKFLKGVRHVLQAEKNDDLILSEEFNRGVAQLAKHDLTYDILIKGHQLPGAIHLVDRHPEQTFVLDHIAKPTISAEIFDERWAESFRHLAERENVFCKFSGVVTEVQDPQWNMDTIRPYWDTALEAFGADRLMFGSDWPVCLLRADYARWIATARSLSDDLSEDEKSAYFGKNATIAYRL